MGGNVSTTAIETIPANAKRFPFDTNSETDNVFADRDPYSAFYNQQIDQLQTIQPTDDSWTLSERGRMASDQDQSRLVTRRQPKSLPPGVVSDNSSDYGSFDTDDRMSTMNPKAAADEAIHELDKLLAEHDNDRQTESASKRSPLVKSKSIKPVALRRQGMNSPQVSIDKSTINATSSRTSHRQMSNSNGHGHGHGSHEAGRSQLTSAKLPSYDDTERQLIESIETEFTRPIGTNRQVKSYY